MFLKSEERLVLFAANSQPRPEELSQLDSLIPQIKNWDYLSRLVIERQLGPLLFKKLPLLSNNQAIPEKVKDQLKQAWLKTISRSMVLIEHFRIIAASFQAEQIEIIALKGIYLSDWLYKEIGLRQFSDIDLLVKEKDGERAIAILGRLGYKTSGSSFLLPESMKRFHDAVHYPPMIKNGVSIEIHTKLHRKYEVYQVDVDELWKNAVPAVIHGVQTKALSTLHLLLHLCLHLDKHFRSGKIQFTCFYDITNLLNQYSAVIDWNAFADVCERFKATDHIYHYLLLSNKYFGASLPDEVVKKHLPSLKSRDEALFLKYLVAGNSPENYSVAAVKTVGKIPGWTNKILYVRQMVFPPKAFMRQRYHLKSNVQLLWYYPYRHLVGFRLGLSAIISRVRKP